MNDTITYRTMRSDDYPAITQMLCDAWHTDPTMDHDLEMKLAEIDLEHCLGRATNAQVAVKDGEIVGVVLGRIDAQETRNGLNSHRTRNMRLLASLLTSSRGRKALLDMKRYEDTNLKMIAEAKKDGHAYQGELVLLLIRPDMRGQGIGKHLFGWMTDQFKQAGVERYFLFTDSQCDYAFYDNAGLTRRAESAVLDNEPHTPKEEAEVHAEDDMLDDHLHAFVYDNETSPANEGVNPLGRD
ncbi:GNAT family N-acetyltransferase [uncultured Bifidobacterium sp.]|uniref:GNAT family N-acetyltransferase n=1 Tax=uncultured Bifidobacterium sp. TaxID=165187 RepID=UPI002586EA9F|nr:GNAT family N-acetyltransferase [uncultured Bifidobacterium sp.]